MALESVRQNPLFASVFQRKNPAGQNKILPFPKFGTAASIPVTHAPVNVSIQADHFTPADVSTAVVPNSARIVLLPKSAKENFFTRALPDASNVLSQLIDALKPETKIDDKGNLYGEFKVKEAEYPPAPTDAEKKTADTATAKANKSAIIGAFKKQLGKVPGDVTSVTVQLPEALPAGVDREELVREIARLTALNDYDYNQFRKGAVPSNNIRSLTIGKSSGNALHGLSVAKATAAATEGTTVGQAINFTRALVDSPANPERTRLIADAAKGLDNGTTLRVNVYDKQWIQNQGMGMFLSVGDGNAPGFPDNEPRLVEMVYQSPDFDAATGKTVLLVGKGIVFDTGGTNLKPSQYIHNMRGDMAGGGAVIGALKAIDELKLKNVKVVGLVPLTENRIGHNASLENRLVTARNGKQVAISNTDAEGRLVLGDAIHYGMETFKPDVVADIATLTGGKVSGLGKQNSVALSGNNRDLLSAVDGIEKSLGRRTANLPLRLAHHRWVTRDSAKLDGKGSFADVYNSVDYEAAARYGVTNPLTTDTQKSLEHSAQGAAFLREFLADPQTPWVHYDMAGAEYDKADAARGNWEWATGFGVEELYNFTKKVADGTLTPNRAKTEVVKAFSSADVDEA